MLAQTEQNHQVEKARGSKANIPRPCRRRRRRAGVWRTEACGPTKRTRSPVDMQESHRGGRLKKVESSGERNAEGIEPFRQNTQLFFLKKIFKFSAARAGERGRGGEGLGRREGRRGPCWVSPCGASRSLLFATQTHL